MNRKITRVQSAPKSRVNSPVANSSTALPHPICISKAVTSHAQVEGANFGWGRQEDGGSGGPSESGARGEPERVRAFRTGNSLKLVWAATKLGPSPVKHSKRGVFNVSRACWARLLLMSWRPMLVVHSLTSYLLPVLCRIRVS